MKTLRLTLAQAVARFLAAQAIDTPSGPKPLFAGCWVPPGRGGALSEALRDLGEGPGSGAGASRDLPVHRVLNEAAMADVAAGFAKASLRRRVMTCVTSAPSGAGALVPAATRAHSSRLPVLLLCVESAEGLEDFQDGTASTSDCLRPVSRYFDRISRPDRILDALARAVRIFTDASACGPVTLALREDVLEREHEFPENLLVPVRHRLRRPQPDIRELSAAARVLERARRPLIVAGGGVRYSEAGGVLAEFAERHGIPITETRAGKGVVRWDNPLSLGAIGPTGAGAATALAAEADLVLAVGTRLAGFSIGPEGLFANPDLRLIHLNITPHDAAKHRGLAIVADAWVGIEALDHTIANYQAPYEWRERAGIQAGDRHLAADRELAADNALRPTIAQVIGAISRRAPVAATLVPATDDLADILNRFGRAASMDDYHLGRGYAPGAGGIAAGIGLKLALPDREVFVLSTGADYLSASSEIVSALDLDAKLTIVVLDDGALASPGQGTSRAIDFAAHATSLGASAARATGIAELEHALTRALDHDRTSIVVIETAPARQLG